MDVTWLGHGCFRLRGRGASVVTDPYPASIGMKLPRLEADLVTVSHGHPNHSQISALARVGYQVEGPGEYVVAGITVTGLPTFHDNVGGAERGANTIYLIEVDDVQVCHLGDLGHHLGEDQLETLGSVDVLLVPVGGGHTLGASQAAEVVRQIEPRVVIPMHFALPPLKLELDSVEKFLKEMGVPEMEAQAKLSIQASSSESETKVVLLEARL